MAKNIEVAENWGRRTSRITPDYTAAGIDRRQVLTFLAMSAGAGSAMVGIADKAAAQTTAPLIAAASDLQFALPELAKSFAARRGEQVRLSFGSSGNFTRQIFQGAPFEMFLSADERYVKVLTQAGRTLDEGALYGLGRIVIVVSKTGPLTADGQLESLKDSLEDSQIRRFAIANPAHAPYGQRAEEALRHAGLWDAIRPFLVIGENVSQAARFATSGSAQGGIIAYSLALAPAVSALGSFDLIPAEWHSPLRQRMVLTTRAGDIARRFYAYIQTPAARSILKTHGFALPE